MAAPVKVEGIESCAGLWGTLNAGQQLALDPDIAESLVRGGLARYVDVADSRDPGVEKKEAKPKSKHGHAS